LDYFINIGYLKKVKPIIPLPDYNLFKSSIERVLTVGKPGITVQLSLPVCKGVKEDFDGVIDY
jgi:hypothetical protein